MGKSSSRPVNIQQQIDPFSQASANIANQLFGQTDPLRRSLLGDFNQIFGSNLAETPYQIGANNWQQFAYPGSQGFNGAAYLAANPDVALDPVFAANPQLHYQRHGQAEGRSLGLPSAVAQVTPAATQDPISSPAPGVQGLSDVSGLIPLIMESMGPLTVNPDNPALFGGAKAALEDQFRIAQNRAREVLPAGGSLNQGMIDLESGRAMGLTQIMADLASQNALAQERGMDRAIGLGGAQMDINQRNIDRALNLASGGATNALQGFSIGGNLAAQSAASQAAQYQAEQSRRGAEKNGLGQAIGQIGAAAVKKCWIARAVYGEVGPEWLMFRCWLELEAPRWLDRLYTRYGERFAGFAQDKPFLLRVLRNLMDRVI